MEGFCAETCVSIDWLMQMNPCEGQSRPSGAVDALVGMSTKVGSNHFATCVFKMGWGPSVCVWHVDILYRSGFDYS